MGFFDELMLVVFGVVILLLIDKLGDCQDGKQFNILNVTYKCEAVK